jgi:hypothetical protein
MAEEKRTILTRFIYTSCPTRLQLIVSRGNVGHEQEADLSEACGTMIDEVAESKDDCGPRFVSDFGPWRSENERMSHEQVQQLIAEAKGHSGGASYLEQALEIRWYAISWPSAIFEVSPDSTRENSVIVGG